MLPKTALGIVCSPLQTTHHCSATAEEACSYEIILTALTGWSDWHAAEHHPWAQGADQAAGGRSLLGHLPGQGEGGGKQFRTIQIQASATWSFCMPCHMLERG